MLIIEDEPIIALDLTRLVRELGHRVVRRRRSPALGSRWPLARETRPGLLLADIRLADGSNGMSAASRHPASTSDLPVIFITAFPEHLLDRRGAGAGLPDHQALPRGRGEGPDRPGAVFPHP